jgi:hypothetical protein
MIMGGEIEIKAVPTLIAPLNGKLTAIDLFIRISHWRRNHPYDRPSRSGANITIVSEKTIYSSWPCWMTSGSNASKRSSSLLVSKVRGNS